MKKTITLYMATKLKDELEKAITEDNDRIKELSKQKSKKDEILEIQQLKEEKSTLLIKLHVLIAEQNLKVGKKESLSNAHYIKTRSEYVREKKLRQDIGEDTKVIRELEKNINALEAKFTKFNSTHKVKIEISQELLDTITTKLEEE